MGSQKPDSTTELAPQGSASGAGASDRSTRGQDTNGGAGRDIAEGGLPTVTGYRVESEIARGGMGRVLAARDLTLDREVAIKVLLPGQHAPAAAARFVREAKITAQLPHPGIPPVYALGTLADRSPFLVMKHVRGRTLAAILKERNSTTDDLPRLVSIFEQICQAVGFAHSQQVLHRDLKPANVMVGPFGEVQVMDWGLAKFLSDTAQTAETVEDALDDAALDDATRTGQVLGTPAYMAPEQARGQAIDARVDVFALGGILCEILTGKPPFTGSTTHEVLALAAAGDVSDACARLAQPGIDAELAELARHCLAPKPGDRPADGKSLADAVASYLARVEERLHEAERQRAAAESRAEEQRKRRMVQQALAGVIGLLLMLGGLYLLSSDRRIAAERAQAASLARDQQERAAKNGTAIDELLDQCEDGIRSDNAREAAVPLEEVGRRMQDEGSEPFKARFERCQADVQMLAALDRIDLELWTDSNTKTRIPRAVSQWSEAFRKFGIVPGTMFPEAIDRRLKESLISDRLLTALELWMGYGKTPDWPELMHTLDPDPFRDEVRAATVTHDEEAFRRLAASPEALTQPPRYAVVLGRGTALPDGRHEQILRAAHRRQPGNLTVLLMLTMAERGNKQEQIAERLGWCRAALALRPESPFLWNFAGNQYFGRQDYDEAIEAYRECLRHDSKMAHAHFGLGAALAAKKELAGAEKAYRDAIQLDPSDARFHNNLGTVLLDRGNLEGAAASLREALRLNPKHLRAHHSLGRALHFLQDLPGAIAEYREAIVLDPKVAAFHLDLGNALRDSKDAKGAAAAYREASRIDPQWATPPFNLANVLFAEQDFAGAIRAARDAVRLGDGASARNMLGAALLESGAIEESLVQFRAAVELDPKHEAARQNLKVALRIKSERDKKKSE